MSVAAQAPRAAASETTLPEVRYCPRCATSLDTGNGFVQEFWVAAETIYFCWCPACSWRGEVKTVERVQAVEPATEDHFPVDRDTPGYT